MSANSDSEFDSMPTQFSGVRSKLGPFLTELDRTFKHQPETFSSDHSKVIFATSHLRGTALKWAMAHPEGMKTYDQFKEDIQARFGNPDKGATALHQLKKLKQHGSARSYHQRFEAYSADCKWTDVTQKNKWFFRGLKDDIKDALTHVDWDWKMDFDKFAAKVIKIDEKLNPAHLKEQENTYGNKE